MSEIITVGLDLAKNVFQVHGADASGLGVLRKKLRRDQVLAFFGELRPCLVAMEACGGAHFWGREIGKLGHEVRLIPPAYVKPFVKRQKNDAADAEAICEAAQRPTMRFVPVKSEETQGAAMVFRIRELLIRQRTQAINALRGHLGEFGQIVPQGAANAARLIAIVEDPENGLPADANATLQVLVAALTHLETEIGKLDAEIARRAKENELARRLMTIPGIGFLSGLLGIGGGSLLIPFLTKCNTPIRQAQAVSSLCSFSVALFGTAVAVVMGLREPTPSGSLGYVYLPALLGIAIPSMITAPLGTRIAYRLPVLTLKRLFGGFLLLTGFHMVLG